MAEIALSIAGRTYSVAAREGDEAHIRHLESILNKHAGTAQQASGGSNGERTLVYLALILADLLDEAERGPPAAASPLLLAQIAERLELIASALEEDAHDA